MNDKQKKETEEEELISEICTDVYTHIYLPLYVGIFLSTYLSIFVCVCGSRDVCIDSIHACTSTSHECFCSRSIYVCIYLSVYVFLVYLFIYSFLGLVCLASVIIVIIYFHLGALPDALFPSLLLSI